MQIENKYSYSTLPSFTATSRGTTVAQEHLSLFPTRLALARWTRGGDIPHVHPSERVMPMRAAWYAQAQRHFMAWLEAGGVHQDAPYCLDCALREDRERAAMLGAVPSADAPAADVDSWPGLEDEQGK